MDHVSIELYFDNSECKVIRMVWRWRFFFLA